MSIQLFEESKPLAEKIDNLLDENNYEKLVVCVHKLVQLFLLDYADERKR